MLDMPQVPQSVDPECMEDWDELREKIGEKWPLGTTELLQARNKDLFDNLRKIEVVLKSLMIIKDKPKEIRRRWKLALDDYERAANCAIAYARRHLGTQ